MIFGKKSAKQYQSNIYLEGVTDAIQLVEEGMRRGLSLEDSFLCLKASFETTRTKLEKVRSAEPARLVK